MIPYTIVYPKATKAYMLPSTRPLMICWMKVSIKTLQLCGGSTASWGLLFASDMPQTGFRG
jgi:hypothetical protein